MAYLTQQRGREGDQRFGAAARWSAAGAAAVGGLALAGWFLEVPWLRSLSASPWQTNPTTAVALIVMAIAVAWLPATREGRRDGAAALGWATATLGLWQLLALLELGPPRLDFLLFGSKVRRELAAGGAGLSVEAALCFVFLGAAVGARRRRFSTSVHPAELLAVATAGLGMLSLLGYLYAIDLQAIDPQRRLLMGLGTASGVLFLAIALLLTLPGSRMVGELMLDSRAGQALRRMALSVLAVLALGGYLRLAIERGGLLEGAVTTTLTVAFGSLLLVALLWWQARQVHDMEVEMARGLGEQRRAEELAGELFEQAPDALVVVDQAGRVTRANHQAENLFGWRREELVGQPVEVLVPEASRGRHVVDRAGYVERPERRAMGEGRELTARRRDGSEVPAEISLGPMRTPEGLQVMVAVRDVTERRIAQREQERRQSEIERLNEELQAFVSSVTHDLRAPLRAIEGFSQRLEESATGLDDEGRRLLSVVQDRASYMRRLIEDLLRLSRISQEPLRLAVIEMARLVVSVLGQILPEEDGTRVEPVLGTLPDAVGDERLLRQVWVNYLDNALKYSARRSDPRIEVDGYIKGREVIYRVRDNGAGFPAEKADRIFRVFERLHAVEEFEGSGVGLATVRRIVHRHGGRVWAEGELDKGATFYFSLPLREPPEERLDILPA